MDSPSSQLNAEIQDSIRDSLASRRPVLHHLNADTTWLLQIPRPESAIRNGDRLYYNVLIDPWLVGGQSDVASWFSQQFHATPSAVQTIAEVEELARETEDLTRSTLKFEEPKRRSRGSKGKRSSDNSASGIDFHEDTPPSPIDLVAISHEFTDHLHRETLQEVSPTVPVFAIHEAAKIIRSWKHFHTVITLPTFGDSITDWRETSLSPLPSYIGISRLLQKEDVLNYHAALMVAFNPSSNEDNDDDSAEAIVYTPHGIFSSDLNIIPSAQPPIRTLAFMHGLHNVRVGTVSGATALQSNLGAHNGLKAQRILNARYWVGTHDEVKTGGGLVSWFLQREIITLKEALEREKEELRHGREEGSEEERSVVESFEETGWVDLGNGESRVLV